MNRAIILLTPLCACILDKSPYTPDSDSPEAPELRLWQTGSAPWDPFLLRIDEGVEGSHIAKPTVLDADGEPVAVTPLRDGYALYAWAPKEDMVAGTATLVGAGGVDLGWEESWEVLPYGQAESFDATALLGRAWRVEGGTWLDAPDTLGQFGDGLLSLYDLTLEVLEVDGEAARFRLVATRLEDGLQCQVFQGVGALDAQGQLRWSAPEMDVTVDEGEVHVEDISLHLGWLPDASAAGGVEGAVTLDTRVLSTMVMESGDPTELCELVDGVVGECRACSTDGEPLCLTLKLHAGTLSEVGSLPPAELPLCGIELDDVSLDTPLFTCDMPELELDAADCGCGARRASAGGLVLALGLIGALRARRR